MNFILLSGGSGKRLWPLSNDIRSKQFIKILKNDRGEYESMLQRVYRQIIAVDSSAKVTVATGKTQVSAIKSQLGDSVSVCVEPCRKDTFPAIALASSYLHEKLGVALDEPVVVCPVDPYVDYSYYETIRQMEVLAEKNVADLILMGVEPMVPSVKYGYIIPETAEHISKVRGFKEKPDKETARKYISQGALWNAGVFAFKLKYLLAKSHSMIDFTNYYDLYMKYETLPQISFDYAVAEKEQSIQVIRYSGEWRDIGSWNMISEVMADETKGNVILDDTCENVNAVNELDIPILAMGCKNMVIAASGDGIFVSDKERSGAMKPFVEAIGQGIHLAEKSWGTYTVIDAQPGTMTAKIFLIAGKCMEYHAHACRNEIWNIVEGRGTAVIDGEKKTVSTGDVVTIASGCKHTLIANTNLSVIEVQIGDEISSKDKVEYDLPEERKRKSVVEKTITGRNS